MFIPILWLGAKPFSLRGLDDLGSVEVETLYLVETVFESYAGVPSNEPELRSWRHLIGLSIGRSRLPAPWAAS